MYFVEALVYATVGNVVSKAILTTLSSMFGNNTTAGALKDAAEGPTDQIIVGLIPLWKLEGYNYNLVRLAGLSGASALIICAIGNDKLCLKAANDEEKAMFSLASRFHLFHSLALVSLPLAKYPAATGLLMMTGTLLFSGSLYYRALTDGDRFACVTKLGGGCLVAAWISLLF